jgi:hypothetical protein
MKNMETRFVGLVNESPKKSWYCVFASVKKRRKPAVLLDEVEGNE